MVKEKTSTTKKTKKTVSASAKTPALVKASAGKPVGKKPIKSTKAVKATKAKKTAAKSKYWEGVGRRKTASARVRIWTQGARGFLVNEKELKDYFPVAEMVQTALAPLEILKLSSKFKVSVLVKGGGIAAQSEAFRHGLSRALIKFNPTFRKKLKKAGFLTRDSRMKERKKPGLKRARKAAQWRKR